VPYLIVISITLNEDDLILQERGVSHSARLLRVEQGGHDVNPDVIKQCYTTGLALLKHYKDFPGVLILLDNSDGIAKTELELRKGVVTLSTSSIPGVGQNNG